MSVRLRRTARLTPFLKNKYGVIPTNGRNPNGYPSADNSRP